MANIEKKSNNTYLITVSLGFDSKGKRIRKRKTVKLTETTERKREKELTALAAEFETQVLSGSYFETGRMTLKELIDLWIKKHGKNLEGKTLHRYKEILEGRVVEKLGHYKLDKLKPLHFIEFYEHLQTPGVRKDGDSTKGLSSKTILQHHRILTSMFNDAVMWEIIGSNPVSKVQPPKVIQADTNTLNEAQIKKMIECLNTEPIIFRTFVLLALYTGARRGELCALKWDCINFENKKIHIKQATEKVPGKKIVVKEPKTKASKRFISVPENCILLLKKYKLWQSEFRISMGDKWVDEGWVFTRHNGEICNPDFMSHTFPKFLEKNKLPKIRLHDIRHTAATMLIANGIDVRSVASRLGHTSTQMTLNVYAHALESVDKKASDKMDEMMDIRGLI